MGNPDLAHLPTAEEYALYREAYAETYPVRPLMNAIDAKDAEIARLKRARREAHVANLVEQRRVEAENKRLRAALKRVELHYSIESLTAGEARNMARDMRDIAREALREESRGGPAECRP